MYPIRGTCCLSVYPDLLLECVLMDSAFNGKSGKSIVLTLCYVTATVLIHIYFLPTGLTNFL